MRFLPKRLVSFSLLMSVLVLVAGCGKNNDAGPVDPGGTGGGLGVYPTPTPFPGGGGTGLNCTTLSATVSECWEHVLMPFAEFPFWSAGIPFPRLSPQGGTGLNYTAPIYARTGDQLLFQGSGSFGKSGFLNWCDTTGNGDIDLDGYKDGSIRYNGVDPGTSTSLVSGMVAKVGTNHFYLLGSNSQITLTANGFLSFGLNANSDYNDGCAMLGISLFMHQYCVDTSGTRITCPLPPV